MATSFPSARHAIIFSLYSNEAKTLLFAGGIGITPILCMAQQLERDGRAFEMHYCGRTSARMAFVERLQAERFSDRISVHVDEGAPEQQLDARAAIGTPAPDKHLYVCDKLSPSKEDKNELNSRKVEALRPNAQEASIFHAG